MVYDERVVDMHHKGETSVMLMNEAPGPEEADSGIPLFGRQGGNVYSMLSKSNISWVTQWNNLHPNFRWPVKNENEYKKLNNEIKRNILWKYDFLSERAKRISCSNSFPKWPKSSKNAQDFVDPLIEDVLSEQNIGRIRNEIQRANPKILIICGEFAFLACVGQTINNPKLSEGKVLCKTTIDIINTRFQSNFNKVWYMGHTRRWSLNSNVIQNAFKQIEIELKS